MDTKELLEDTRLRFVTDKKPGISREKKGDSFLYFAPDGTPITDEETLTRIKSLVIPPAWENVWICTSKNGYLQATGRDNKGRKQYRYHKRFVKETQEQKFDHMLEFVKVLPLIRSRVKVDMEKMGMPREKVLATVVWLLENTLIRVGNEEYVEENKSYGLTTLRNKHAEISKDVVTFEFKGKSGVYHKVKVRSKKVAKIIRRCQELPGQDLFEYKADDGMQTITSDDVNTYLQEITGTDITAKDFRTWAGTVLAAMACDKLGICEEKDLIKKNITEVVKKVAKQLRNKPATSRKYYIHPIIFSAYEQREVLSTVSKSKKEALVEGINELDESESSVFRMLIQYSASTTSIL